jgi:hypothetical protein
VRQTLRVDVARHITVNIVVLQGKLEALAAFLLRASLDHAAHKQQHQQDKNGRGRKILYYVEK